MGSTEHNQPVQLQQCFFQENGGWYIHMTDEDIGPYADKADAQMALMYYSLRALWPDEKELRSFARNGS